MKFTTVLLIAGLLLAMLPDASRADIYRWIDASGTMHYASSLENIPAAYRNRVEIIAAYQRPEAGPDLPEEHVIHFAKASDGIILVDVLLNDGVKARMVLDTGASLVVISEALSRKLGRDTATGAGRIILKTAGGEIEGRPAMIDRIELGSAVREGVRAVVNGHHDVFQGFDGLLGSSFLDGYKLTIDYQNGAIHLRRP